MAYFLRAIFGGAYLRRELRFKVDWASLIVGSKFTVFALFYFVFEGNFPSTSSRGLTLTEGFLRYRFRGLIFGGAYFGILRYLTWLRTTSFRRRLDY